MPRQSIFNTPPAEYDVPNQLDRWRKGMRPSARHFNQTVDAINRMRRFRGPQQAQRVSGGGGGGGGITGIEVKIHKAIYSASQPGLDQEEIDQFDAVGEHLRCAAVNAEGEVNTELYLVVFPIFPRTVSNFLKTDLTQIYNAADPDKPHFIVLAGAKGLTLTFGAGEQWTTPPAAGDEVVEPMAPQQGPPMPQFSAYREKAYNSAAQSDIKNHKTSLEAYYADNQFYPY